MNKAVSNSLVELLLILILLSVSIATVNSQSDFNNEYSIEGGNGDDYVKLDDLLSILPVSSLHPIKGYASEFSFIDSVIEPPVSFGIEDGDPRPSVWETSEYMIGKVAVYIIFVESNGEIDLNLYDWDKNSIEWAKNGIYVALNWWRSQYPFTNPGLEFYVNRETVIGYTGYEPILRPKYDDKLWVPDVLRRLGCGEGSNYYEIGKKCADTIRQNWRVDWAFIIFVINSGTLSPGWPDARAFAYIGGPYVVLPFGWFYHMMFEGTDGLARIVAHEIGHIFGATNEYDGKPERGGYLYELDNDGSGCIMDSPNKWCISSATMRQIGWVDDNHNGYPDILENKPVIKILGDVDAITDSDKITITGVFMLEPYPCRRPSCRSVTINKIIPFNSSGTLTALDGPFDSAYEPFQIVYEPRKVGYHTISVSIMDAVVGNIESYAKEILYTYLEVQSMETTLTKQRVDVGAEITIKFKIVTAHDKMPLESGRVYVNKYEAVPLGEGWFKATVSSNNVGKYHYQPTSAEVTINTSIGSGKLTKIRSTQPPIEVIYDRVIVSLEAVRERVDVGTEAPITISAWYEYDKQPFIGEILLSNDKIQKTVGKYTYKATKIIDELYGLQAFITNEINVIFDKVRIELITQKERVDIGSVAPITIKAWYEYDKTPFQGRVYFNHPLSYDKVGLVTYHVTKIEDELYGLNVFESNQVQVVFDMVIITLSSSKQRVDIGAEAPIIADARYAYDSSSFVGKIHLSIDKRQNVVGLYNYTVAYIEDELYGLTVFQSDTLPIIFDKVVINLATPYERVEIGKRAELSYEAYYWYDKAPFEGEILLNNELVFYNVQQATYTVSEIIDYKHGLKSFESNSVKVIFDKIETSLHINTMAPFTVEVVLETYFASDRTPITLGTLCVRDNCVSQQRPGKYSISYLEIAPVTFLTGRFIVKGFDEIKLESFVLHIGNSIIYLLLSALIVSIIAVRQRAHRKKKTRVTTARTTICPRCGNMDYIGVKLGPNLWEYECQLCGEKWYVRK